MKHALTFALGILFLLLSTASFAQTNNAGTDQTPSSTPPTQVQAEANNPAPTKTAEPVPVSETEKEPVKSLDRVLATGLKDIKAAAISSDGALAAASFCEKPKFNGCDQSAVYVWDTVSGEKKLTLPGPKHIIFALAFSPDGKRLAVANGDHTITVWKMPEGTEEKKIEAFDARVFSLAFSSNGDRIAAGSGPDVLSNDGVKIWPTANWTSPQIFKGHVHGIQWLAFTPDGRLLVTINGEKSSSTGLIRTWDLERGKKAKIIHVKDFPVSTAAVSPDGTAVALGSDDGQIKIYDIVKVKERLTWEGHSRSGLQNPIGALTFLPSGQSLISGGNEGRIRFWQSDNGKETRQLEGHTSLITALSVSQTAETLLSVSLDGSVRVWSLKEAK